jgi:hypothetical protein
VGDDGGVRLGMIKCSDRSGGGFPGRGFRGRGFVLLLLEGFRRSGFSGGGFTGVEVAYGLTHLYLGAFRDKDFERAIGFGEYFRGDFICFDFEKGFAGGYGVPVLLFPASKDS